MSFAVLALVLIGAGGFLFYESNIQDVPTEEPAAAATPSTTPQKPIADTPVLVGEPAPVMVNENSGVGAFAQKGTVATIATLLSRGGDQICAITTNTADVQSKGMIYISGKKVRGIFTSKVIRTGMVIDSNMVQLNGFVYSWSSLMSQGFKAPVADLGKNQVIPISDQYSFEYNQGVEYRCNDWTVDPSFFELPTWVSFGGTK